MQLLNLVARGYGTYVELASLDTPDIFDMVEHAHLCDLKERYYYQQKALEAKNSKD